MAGFFAAAPVITINTVPWDLKGWTATQATFPLCLDPRGGGGGGAASRSPQYTEKSLIAEGMDLPVFIVDRDHDLYVFGKHPV